MAVLKNIIINPIITEKATVLKEMRNQYTFKVTDNSNRLEIKKAVEEKYNVAVKSVKTLVVHGKKKSSVGRKKAKRKHSDWKKALVMLKEGDSIEVVEGV